MNLSNKLVAVSDLIRLKKQYGTVLLLCPTLWSLVMASKGMPDFYLLFIFTAGCFLMRSAGCAINDIADRNFDVNVERTKDRPIASGRLTINEAFFVFTILVLTAFGLVLTLNTITIKLSFVAILLAVAYPFVKRFSHFPQVFLGMAFGWGAVMAWSATTGEIALPAVFFFIANIFWSTAYDTIYALMDIEDDKKIGVKSTAIFFGNHVYKAILISYTLTIVFLALAGFYGGSSEIYFYGIVVLYAFFVLTTIVITSNLSKVNFLRAFIYNSFYGLLFLLFIYIDFIKDTIFV